MQSVRLQLQLQSQSVQLEFSWVSIRIPNCDDSHADYGRQPVAFDGSSRMRRISQRNADDGDSRGDSCGWRLLWGLYVPTMGSYVEDEFLRRIFTIFAMKSGDEF